MKILFIALDEAWQRDYFTQNLAGHEISFVDSLEDVSEDGFASTEVLSVFVGNPVSAESIAQFSSLKLIVTRSTGFDHVDVAAAKEQGVIVSNVPFYGENTVAEHAMALLLALARKLRESFDRTRGGLFTYDGLQGWDIMGKRLGLIGGGHIGMHIARMAKGFGMDVVVYDILQNEALSSEIGFSYASLDEVLQSADVISLHVPLNEHTKHILDTEAFLKMKKGMYLINTARGALIDTEALLFALENDTIAGAGLDVLEDEGVLMKPLTATTEQQKMLERNRALMNHDKVLVTPHNAFNSHEAVQRILTTTVENITGFASGSPVHTV